MSEEDISRIVEEDRHKTNNKLCGYSVSSSESCSSNDGKFVCQLIKKVQRSCPGEHPVTIYSRTEKSDGSEADLGDQLKGFGEFEMGDIDPFSMAKNFFDFYKFPVHGEHPRSNQAPHRMPRDHKNLPRPLPPSRGEITGPDEEI